MPWRAPAKIKRGGHFCVLTGMWVFRTITLHRATYSAQSRNKIRLAFHFVERKKHKKFSKFHSVSFSRKFCSYFIGCGFAYRAKSWIQLRTNMYITIFVSKVQAAALNPLSVFKTLLKLLSLSSTDSKYSKQYSTGYYWPFLSQWELNPQMQSNEYNPGI